MDRLLLTVPEVAERLNLSRPKVYDLLRSGELKSVKVGRCRRIPVRMLDEYIALLEPCEVLAS